MIETQLTPVRLTMGAAVEFILLLAAEILAGDQAAEANGCEKVSLCTIARLLGYRVALVYWDGADVLFYVFSAGRTHNPGWARSN